MKLSDRLRELRTTRELTLKELAERTNLSVSFLSDIERGRTTPTLNTLESLAQGFGISVLDLLSGVDFAGQLTDASLPEGLAQLANDPEYKDELNAEWIETLSKIQMRGKRPVTKREWLKLYLSLRDILD